MASPIPLRAFSALALSASLALAPAPAWAFVGAPGSAINIALSAATRNAASANATDRSASRSEADKEITVADKSLLFGMLSLLALGIGVPLADLALGVRRDRQKSAPSAKRRQKL